MPKSQPHITLLRMMRVSAFLPAALSSLLSSLSSILLMGASAWLIATAALLPPLAALSMGITFVRACGLFRAAFRYLDRWLSHQATFRQLTRLRLLVYRLAIAHLPIKDTPMSQGVFLHDLTAGIDVLRDFYLRAVAPPLLALLLAVIAALCLHSVAPHTSWIPFALFLASLFIPYVALERSRYESAKVVADTIYRDTLIDAQSGLFELRTGSTKSHPLAGSARFFHVLESSAEYRGTVELCARRHERYADMLLHIVHATLFVLLFYLLIKAQTLDGIWLAVYVLSAETLFQAFLPLPEAVRAFGRTKRVAERILHMSQDGAYSTEKSHVKIGSRTSIGKKHIFSNPSIPNSSPLLAASNLSFAYPKSAPLFSDLSFSIQFGERIAFIGESGTGKTTLFHILLRLYESDSGTLRLAGRSYADCTDAEIRAHFASATQACYLFSDSVRANFKRFHPNCTEEDMLHALHCAAFSDTLEELPQGLDTPIGEDGSLLSGGQRQRLLLALALIANDRPILLLDEPTTGLDRTTADLVLRSIHDACTTRTLLLISHDTSAIAHVTRTIILPSSN